jgi:hypothetical protein
VRFLLLLLVLAGCSHVRLDASSDTSSGTAAGATVGLRVEMSSLAAALLLGGFFIAAATDEAREPRPELDPSRPVNEQDCSRPVALGGNLRCR